MPNFSIRQEAYSNGAVQVRISGYLDAHTFEHLEETIANLFASGKHRLVVNLSGVEYISSAGAGVFIWALTEAQEAGGNVVLLNPQESVQDVFDLLGLSQVFNITHDQKQALAVFGTG